MATSYHKNPGAWRDTEFDVVAKHPWDSDKLHLEMGQNPHDPVRDGDFAGG